MFQNIVRNLALQTVLLLGFPTFSTFLAAPNIGPDLGLWLSNVEPGWRFQGQLVMWIAGLVIY